MKEKYESVLERYKSYKEQGLIETTTFHQSYGYEEFIEGLKPVINKQNQNLEYTIEDGVFKKFCNNAVSFEKEFDFDEAWELLLKRVNQNKEYVFTRRTGSRLKAFLKNNKTFRVAWSGGTFNDLTKAKTREQHNTCSYSDREKLSGGNRWLFDARQAVIDELEMLFEQKNNSTLNSDNYVFIIDEINRGNISKIFGELITLIESAKRLGQPEGMTVRLPYSQKLFGMPENVYLLGTMNTADRSIATIDTALRRRFQFKEMQPNPEVLEGVSVEGLNVSKMFSNMNRKISVLYDREHTIGHAYFMPLIKEPTIKVLSEIFENNIIPLLQEYFFDDYEKIRLILGDVNKENEEEQFIVARQNDFGELFGNVDYDFEAEISYEVNQDAFDNIESYRSI